MALNYKAVANILKEKGWIDFKPFKTESSDLEVWGYKTKEATRTIFHFCDSEFKELDRESIQLSAGPLFIMDTPDNYSVWQEGFSVEDYKNQHNITGLVWCCLIAAGNEVIHWGRGYLKLFDDLYLLEPTLRDIEEKISNKNTWEPERGITMYNPKEDFYVDKEHQEISCLYYGTYRNCHFIRKYNKESDSYNYYVLDNEGKTIFEGYPILWKRSDCELCLIHFEENENNWILNLFDGNNHEIVLNAKYKYEYGDYREYYADDNVMVIKDTHYYDYFGDRDLLDCYLLIINKKGEVLYDGEYNIKGKISRIANGLILVHGSSGRYMIYNSSATLLTENVDLKKPYFVFSGGVGFYSSPDQKGEHNLYGVMRSHDLSVIVPAVYECVRIVEYEPVLVVIVGNRQYEEGKNMMKYGLYVNSIMKIPVNTVIEKLSDEYVAWEKDEKYGLLYHGEECLPPVYDDISWDGFIKLTKGDEMGVFSKKLDFLSEIKYYDVKLLEKDKIMIADENLYYINDGVANLIIDAEAEKMEYLASDDGYHMFLNDNEELGYNCFFISSNGKVETIELTECKDYYDVETCDDDGTPYYERRYLDFEPGSYICIYEGSYYFDTEENCFYHYNEICKSNEEEYYYEEAPDDYDYERDTYYALGGDDYDRFKEEGGSIDAMMDGMGY